ncbi:MAG: lamin tail domain-containing protein, partial [Flavobacterium sp.]
MIKKISSVIALATFVFISSINTEAQLVINEVLINATTANNDGSNSPNTGEWTELINAGSESLDASCYVMTDGDWSVTLPQGTILAPGEILTIGSPFSQIPNLSINIANCNCTSSNNAGDVGVFTNGDEQIVIANAAGQVVDGFYWGNGQFASTPSFTTEPLFGCNAVSIQLSINDPNIQQVTGNIVESTTVYSVCDGSGILVNGNLTPSPGQLNFVAQPIDANPTIQNEICPNTGSITLNPIGTGPFAFEWLGDLSGNTSNVANNLADGVWSVQIT